MIYVQTERCTGYRRCVEVCPRKAITAREGIAVIDSSRCTECETCVQACVEGTTLYVRGLDAFDGSPVMDIKLGYRALHR